MKDFNLNASEALSPSAGGSPNASRAAIPSSSLCAAPANSRLAVRQRKLRNGDLLRDRDFTLPVLLPASAPAAPASALEGVSRATGPQRGGHVEGTGTGLGT
ncbi:hypothetical protein EVAR_22573_1 [Eumeta japonica]|uniref:Uncharacterized protein n=1 Tax=Eumeta variegata TaxID=151549 RepID=A0A4C1U852_EUMVA|nr:hypothetical protein EVAR_22573_1 [Eumeta japonica]